MSWPQFELWLRFFEKEPQGEYRDDIRMGIIASTMATIHSGKSFKPIDFIPDFSKTREKKKKKPITHEEFREHCLRFMAASKPQSARTTKNLNTSE